MVKSIYFFKRKPGMGVEAFQEYWRTAHAELVKRIPELRKYVQCHTRLSAYRRLQGLPSAGGFSLVLGESSA